MAHPLRKASLPELVYEMLKACGFNVTMDRSTDPVTITLITIRGHAKEHEEIVAYNFLMDGLSRLIQGTPPRSEADKFWKEKTLALPPARRTEIKEDARIARELLLSDIPLTGTDRARLTGALDPPIEKIRKHVEFFGYLIQLRLLRGRRMKAGKALRVVAEKYGLDPGTLDKQIRRYLHPK
jgi:hypothetical protein